MARSNQVNKTAVPRGKKPQAELIRELQELIATKDKFFSIIAHDLRSPFNVILGVTDLLLSDMGNLNEKEVRNYLEMIRSVFQNLVSNAIKFTPCGGCVHVEASRKNGEIEVSVRDSGVGIRPDKLCNIFGTGKHSAPGTDDEPGSGLGLVICRDFVEKHGGKIWAESDPGKGSVFRFTLPAQKPSS